MFRAGGSTGRYCTSECYYLDKGKRLLERPKQPMSSTMNLRIIVEANK